MFCPECGMENNEEDLFCERCGTSLKEYKEEAQKIQNPNTQTRSKDTKRRGKKSPSKFISLIGVEVIVMIGLFIGLYTTINKQFDPKEISLKYGEALLSGEWSKVYDYCDFPQNSFLTKQMYVNVKEQQEEKKQYVLLDVESADGLLKQEHNKNFVIEYQERGKGEEESLQITLAKTGKKQFLFWDEWKVVPSDLLYKDMVFTIPKQATLVLNGVEMKENEEIDESGKMKNITVPYLFLGKYQMEVKEEGMETFKKVVEVNEGGCEDDYIVLEPNETVKKALVEQAGKDLKKIIESALQGKQFSEVEDCFSSTAKEDSFVVYEYNDIVDNFEDIGFTLKTLNIKKISGTVNSMNEDDEITLNITMDAEKTQKSEWSDEIMTSSDEVTMTMSYVKEDDNWKLTGMPS